MNTHQTALQVATRLTKAGHIALFAGGCVRDQLLGLQPKDYDIATSASPHDVRTLFKKTDAIGAHFGVILVKENQIGIEVATFRSDGSYKDGRHPESITFTTAEDDAQRRDFTINGLFQNPFTGEIIDYVGGRADIENQIIRAIGNPVKRFQEDALRLLRAIRFAVHTGFTIEPLTWQAICDCAPLLEKIASERIRDEFSRIITAPRRELGFRLLLDSTLTEHFLPELRPLIGCEQPPQWHPEGDVFNHTRIALDLLPDDASLELCLAVMLHDIGKPSTFQWDEADQRIRFSGHDAVGAEMAEVILRRLRYPNQIIEDVREMVARHMHFMHVQDMRKAKLKRFMARPTFTLELELHRVDCASSNGFTDNYDFLLSKIEEFAQEPIIPPPLVSGKDLINLGLHPSPQFKEILEEIQTRQLEGELSTREEALLILQELAAKPSDSDASTSKRPRDFHTDHTNGH